MSGSLCFVTNRKNRVFRMWITELNSLWSSSSQNPLTKINFPCIYDFFSYLCHENSFAVLLLYFLKIGTFWVDCQTRQTHPARSFKRGELLIPLYPGRPILTNFLTDTLGFSCKKWMLKLFHLSCVTYILGQHLGVTFG